MPTNSQANIRTGPSKAASDTTFPRKPRGLLPKPSSMWIVIDRLKDNWIIFVGSHNKQSESVEKT
jgi:hypothetical protein